MPFREKTYPGALALLLVFLCACKGGGSGHHSSPPRSNIDLAVSGFTVTPTAADPEDSLTLTGTIKNMGTETANPNLGDKFFVRFNLSKDGTFELKEQGFLEVPVTDPIPPGGSYPFHQVAPYGGGDTQSLFGVFCNCATPDCCRQLPQLGVIGVKADSGDDINELNEGNNFGFNSIQVVGTLVAASAAGCDVGTATGSSGCYLTVNDDVIPPVVLRRPCTSCSPTDIVLPNELHRLITVSLEIRGCTNNQSPNGTCGAGWTIVATTSKPGLAASTRTFPLTVSATFGQGSNVSRTEVLDIRDPNY
jgi:hypothetical protein